MDGTKRAALLTAINLGSITAAAEKLGYTQSGLSYIIASAEAEVGFPLLDRSRSGVRPTASCLRLLPLLRDLERKNALLDQEAADIRGLVTGELGLAVFPSIARYLLSPLIRSFEQKFPGVTLRLMEGGHGDCARWVHSGEAELLLGSPQPGDGLEWMGLMQDEILAVVPVEHPLAALEALPLAQAGETPFILLAPDYDYDIVRTLNDARFQPNVHFTSKDEMTIIAMVRENLGISIMPGLHLRTPPAGVKVLSLEPRSYRTLGVGYADRDSLSPAGRRFLDLARRELTEEEIALRAAAAPAEKPSVPAEKGSGGGSASPKRRRERT